MLSKYLAINIFPIWKIIPIWGMYFLFGRHFISSVISLLIKTQILVFDVKDKRRLHDDPSSTIIITYYNLY